MIWLMVWLTCVAGQACWLDVVEQEFPTRQECLATLAWYEADRGVIGVCRAWEPE